MALRIKAVESIVTDIITLANNAITSHGIFSIAVSGGSMCATLAPELLAANRDHKTDYSKWHWFLVDERFVDENSVDSNYRLLNEFILSKLNVSDKNVHKMNQECVKSNDLQLAAKMYEKDIFETLGNAPSFDLILLGMGPDGHTASLFPGHELLNEKSSLVSSISDSPKPPSRRITFTLNLIRNSMENFFLVTGKEKADTIRRISNKEELPAGLVMLETNCTVYLDSAASSFMP